MIVAAPGQRGPFTTADLPAVGVYDPHAPVAAPVARLLRAAAAHYTTLPELHPDRPVIERLIQRIRQGSTIDELCTADLRSIVEGGRRVLAC